MILQKVLGKAIGTVGIGTSLIAALYYVSQGTWVDLLNPSVSLVAPVAIGFLASSRLPGVGWKFFQAFLVSLFGIIAILYQPEAFWGHALLVSGYYLFLVYGIFPATPLKIGFAFGLFASVELSYFMPGQLPSFFGLGFLLFDALFVYIIDQLIKYKAYQETACLGSQVKEMAEKLEKYKRSAVIDQLCKQYGILPGELKIMEELYYTHGSNQEIADSLGLSVATVKVQLYNLYNKIGVDTRQGLIHYMDDCISAA